MAIVHIPAAHRDLTNGEPEARVDGTTVAELLDSLDERFPGLRDRFVDAGGLRPGLTVVVEGAVRNAGLRTKVSDGSRVYVLPAMSGGA